VVRTDIVDQAVDASRFVALRTGGRIDIHRLDALGAPAATVGRHAKATYVDMSRGRTLATATEDGEVRLWRIVNTSLEPWRTLRGPGDVRRVGIDPSGRFLAGGPLGEQDPTPFVLWDLRSVPDAAPVSLKKEQGRIMGADFSPDGAWMGSVHWAYAVLWRLHDQLPRRLQLRRGSASEVAFSPDGRSLIASGMTGVLETFPIHVDAPARRLLRDVPGGGYGGLQMDPAGRFVAVVESGLEK
jgi:hypothetical protein